MRKPISSFFPSFLLGATLYPIIELLFRGRTHISMSILGGICSLAIALVDRALGKRKWVRKAFLSSLIILQLEFIAGVILNLRYQMNVWDYSDEPFQLAGQICLRFWIYWFLLSLIAMAAFHLAALIRKKIFLSIGENGFSS